MKKYLLSMFCLMLLAVLAPLSVKAATKDASVSSYTPPEVLTASDMAAAQGIGMGTVQVDLTRDDYRLYKLNVSANQAYKYESAKFGDGMGYWSAKYFDADGKDSGYLSDGSILSEKSNTTVYILIYSNYPTDTYFTISDGMFRDNVSQKSSDGTRFGFVPSVSGTYGFALRSSYDKSVYLYVNVDGTSEYGDEKDYSSTLEVSMTAGRYYEISASVYGPYTLTLTKSPASDAVKNQIAGLGAITANSGAAVDGARAAYNALTPAEQKLVSNLGTLTAAEKAYADATRPAVSRVKVKSVKSAKAKQALVKWKKVSGANGYQVTYSLKKSFKKAKSVKVSPAKAKVTLKKLKRKKVYYVKVRAFKNYRGQTYYGAYSKVKKVKVK